MNKVVFIILALSIFISMALLFSTVLLPVMLNKMLIYVFPDYGIGYWEKAKAILDELRPIGYASLLVAIAIIILGFVLRKKSISVLGSIGLYLPVFGHFAFTMFFLAGIAITRILWLPLYEISPIVLKLGHLILVPYIALATPLSIIIHYIMGRHISFYVSRQLSMLIMGIGLFIFTLGVFTWFYGKLHRKKIIDFWIYKYSRHPQYLGYIIWSYGLLTYTMTLPSPKGGYYPVPTLPWLISIFVLIAIALKEENSLVEKYGMEYIKYKIKTPFFMPLPRILIRILTIPIKILIGKNNPETIKDIVIVMTFYLAILILLSIPIAIVCELP